MKILFQIRKDYIKNKAGDTVIFENLYKGLKGLNIDVNICNERNIDVKKYDIVHIFNTIRVFESYKFYENAKDKGIPIVLTPIYWNLRDFYFQNNDIESLRIWDKNEKKRLEILKGVDVILVHAKGEIESLEKNYGLLKNYEILPYGVDDKFYLGNMKYLKKKYGIDEYILCVGRIHKQKNQISLFEALKDEEIPIVLAGNINDTEYLKSCLKVRNKNVLVFGNSNNYDLVSLYKSAKVHILPSLFEYPGLASLEAAASGCNVITTNVGTTKEVFGNRVSYCNPYDITDIKNKVMRSFATNKNPDLASYIKVNNNWNNICKKLLNIYELLL